MRQVRQYAEGRRERPLTIGVILLLSVCTLTQCVCQSARKDEGVHTTPITGPPPKVITAVGGDSAGSGERLKELPETLDIVDLDGDEQQVLLSVLKEHFDPCGEPISFLESLKKSETCDQATNSVKLVVNLVQKGLSKRQIVQQLLKYLARASMKAEFDLTETPYIGDPEANHTIVEFMDFQCPYCKVASKELKRIAKKHGAVLYIKHLPIEHHEFARKAALASLAADRQGKFWEVYEALFAHQDTLSDEVIDDLVQKSGLDLKRFAKDVADPTLEKLLKRDEGEADRFKVDGTPTFFVDGYMVELDDIEGKLSP